MKPKQRVGFAKQIYATLLQAYRPYLGRIFATLGIGLLGRVLVLSGFHMVARQIDTTSVVSDGVLKSLIFQLLVLMGVALLCALIFRVLFSRYSALAVSSIHDETVIRVSRLPMFFFDQNPVGKITTRFSSDYGNVFRLFGGPLAEFCSIIFDLIAITVVIVIVHPLYLSTVGLALISFYWILKLNQNELRSLRKNVSIQRAPSITHFSETVQGGLVIRLSGHGTSFQNRFAGLNRKFLQSKQLVFKQIFRFSFQLTFLASILFFVNGLFCIYLVRSGLIGPAMTTVVLGLTLLATNSLQMFFEWYSQFDEALVGVERMDEYLHLPLEPGSSLPKSSQFRTHPQLQLGSETPIPSPKIEKGSRSEQDGILKISNLYLQYPGRSELALENISFQLSPGEKLGIIGKTGSGKSSLIATLLRLYPIQSGSIMVQGRIEENTILHRAFFSVISQDSFFIRASLYENIDPERQTPKAYLDSMLKEIGFSFSLDFEVEENGKNLSSGEKQVISLIRGLIKKSEIFIFDEATANVDLQSEHLIQSAITRLLKDRTQIRIAHRIQTVEDCDRILWLESGKIKKFGPAEEVLAGFRSTL